MSFERLGRAACRSYLLVCDRGREALLVDPLLDDAEEVERLVEDRGLRVVAVVDTHTHADHLSAGGRLAARWNVPYALHASTGVGHVDQRLRDGEVLEVGERRVRVIHTPGHTEDSLSLHAGSDLVTGDFLFLAQDGAGRLDLPGGDAGAHWDSLQRLKDLPDDTRVLPGHDYQDLPESDLGVERRRNPRFQQVTREEYVAWQRAVAMDTPAWMLEVIAANLGSAGVHEAHHADHAPVVPAERPAGLDLGVTGGGGACVSRGACATVPTGRVPLIGPREAFERLADPVRTPRAFLLDVREPFEFRGPAGSHARGAVNVPLGSLSGNLDRVPNAPDTEVLVICHTGARSATAAEHLIERGWRRVFNVDGGTAAWIAAGLPVER